MSDFPPPNHASSAASRAFLKSLWFGVGLLLLLVGIVVTFALRESLERHRQQTLQQAQNRSEVLEQSLGSSIQILEVSLDAVVEEYRRLRTQPRFDGPGFQSYLQRMHGRLPQFLEGLRATDGEGGVRFGNGLNPATPISIADREYFHKLKREPKAGLIFSKPILARVSKKWAITLCRRLDGPTGAFEGITYATVPLERLTQIFSNLDTGPRGVVALRDPGITILAHHPLVPEVGGISGERPPPPAFRDLVASGRTQAVYTVAALDRVERIYAVRRIREYPLYILVGLATEDYRDEWRQEVRRMSLLLVPFVFVTLIGATLLQRGWSRQRNALDSLARQEQRFRLLFENAGDAIFIQDLNGRLLEVNQAACDRLGVPKPERGSPLAPELAKRLRAPEIRDLLEGQDELIFETTQIGPQEELQHVEISSRRLEYDGRPAILSVSRDLGERRRIDRLKEEFISLVSHELRTPLTAIRGAIGLLRGGVAGALSPQAEPLLDNALRNTDRLVRIVNDLLDLQRMEKGMLPVALEDLQLQPVLQEALAAQEPYGTLFEVTYALEMPPTPIPIKGDPQRLQQILANLLSNATKFSPPGGVVTLRALPAQSVVRIEVIDDGPGIPEGFRKHVFHKFSQSQTGNTRQAGGTGLGLSITKALVELHGGRIGFLCPPRGGTIFWFELPLAGPA